MGQILGIRQAGSPVSGGGLSKYRYALTSALQAKDHASNSRLYSALHELLEELKGIATEELMAKVHNHPTGEVELQARKTELGNILRIMDSELADIGRVIERAGLGDSKMLLLEARKGLIVEMQENVQLVIDGKYEALLKKTTPDFGRRELRVLVEGLREESGKAA